MSSLNFSILTVFLFYSASSFSMMRALNTAATGMVAQEMMVNSISNNLANANTFGFKRERAEFEDLLYQTVTEAGSRSDANTQYSIGLQVGSGAKVSGLKREFKEGSVQITNQPWDMMIQGDGFFGILLPDGRITFTRNGSFNVDRTGTLVTHKGYKVFPGVTFPPNTVQVTIGENGSIDYYVRGNTAANNLGTISIFTFINPAGLQAMGGNMYRATQASGEPIQRVPSTENAGALIQGSLETSNVSVVNEMTNLIKAQRGFEMNQRIMGVADQMLQTVNSIR